MKRLAAIVALVAAGCTTQQVATFQSLTPTQQASVTTGLYRPAETPYVPPGGFLACVRHHESDTAGGYQAENPTSTASGAYQFLDSTWRNVSAAAGHPSGHAAYAPPWVQDAVAVWVLEHIGRSPWNGTGC